MDNNVFQTVEYSRDKWRMKKVPQALLFFLVGMAFVIYVDPQPLRSGILIAFVVMVAITFVYGLGAILLELIFEGRTTAIRLLATAIAIVCLVAIYWNRPGDLLSPRYPMGPNVETYVLGWMMIIGAGGWITFALYRHFKPPRPILTLSPAGVSYHVSGLKDLLIPWEHVQGVDGLEIRGDAGPPIRFPEVTVVLLSQEFYERHILSRRGKGPSSGWNSLFRPRGALMQMVLHHELFAIASGDIRGPLEARWQAFRAAPVSAASNPETPPQIYGAWSIHGPLWQKAMFLVPIIGILAILGHAAVTGLR